MEFDIQVPFVTKHTSSGRSCTSESLFVYLSYLFVVRVWYFLRAPVTVSKETYAHDVMQHRRHHFSDIWWRGDRIPKETVRCRCICGERRCKKSPVVTRKLGGQGKRAVSTVWTVSRSTNDVWGTGVTKWCSLSFGGTFHGPQGLCVMNIYSLCCVFGVAVMLSTGWKPRCVAVSVRKHFNRCLRKTKLVTKERTSGHLCVHR